MQEGQAEPTRILVPLALVVTDEVRLLGEAARRARATEAEVLLLHVLPPSATTEDGTATRDEANARSYLDAVAMGLRRDGLRVHCLVRVGPVAKMVAATAREQQTDLILVGGTVQREAQRLVNRLRWGHGRLGGAIVRAAPCPVVRVLAPAAPRAGLAGVLAAPPLRGFAADAARAGPLAPRPLGARAVRVARIVGSVDRAGELGADFRPRRRNAEDDFRSQRVRTALERGVALPAVELYQLGYGYYVLDGHHRVATALALGQVWLDADVTVYVPIGDADAHRVLVERRRFEQETGLTQIGATRPGTYPQLLDDITRYRREIGSTDRRRAAEEWFADVFRPAQRRLRAQRLALPVPDERTADRFVRLAVPPASERGSRRRPEPPSRRTQPRTLRSSTAGGELAAVDRHPTRRDPRPGRVRALSKYAAYRARSPRSWPVLRAETPRSRAVAP